MVAPVSHSAQLANMKSSAPMSAATTTSSSRRSQPMRQARSNPARRSTLTTMSKDAARNGAISSIAQPSSLSQKFYPALTSFTDAIDALPAEIIRNFTLLKEVDAKACHPEEQLRRYIAAARALSPPADLDSRDPAFEFLRRQEELRRRRDEAMMNGENPPPETDFENMDAVEQFPETRRSRLQQVRMILTELLPMLDEKIHVISGTVETLNKHNARVEEAYEYLESEIPEIYRKGDPEHWGYKAQVPKGLRAAAAERAASAQQAAQAAAAAEEAAASSRAELRRDALARKQAAAAAAAVTGQDYDEAYQIAATSKRPYNTSRGRKEAESLAPQRAAETQAAPPGVPSPGPAVPQPKRRKPNTNAAGEKGTGEKLSAARGTTSPRSGTPVGKRSNKTATAGAGAAGTAGSTARRRPNPASAVQSPNLALSPVHPAFSLSLKAVNGKDEFNTHIPATGENHPVPKTSGPKVKDKQLKESKETSATVSKGKNVEAGTEEIHEARPLGKVTGSRAGKKDAAPEATVTKMEGDGDETMADAENTPLLKIADNRPTGLGISESGRKSGGGTASPTKEDRDGGSKNQNAIALANDLVESAPPTTTNTSVPSRVTDHPASDEIPQTTPVSTSTNKRGSISTTASGAASGAPEKSTGGGKRKRGSVDHHHGTTAAAAQATGAAGAAANETHTPASSAIHGTDSYHTTINANTIANVTTTTTSSTTVATSSSGTSKSNRQTTSSHSNKPATFTQSEKHTTSSKSARDRDREHGRDHREQSATTAHSHRPHSSSHGRGLKIEKVEEDEDDEDEEPEEVEDEEEDEDMDEPDPDEPRYCICNRVSFGEMVACDGKDCKVEWFHLSCVGLARPPKKDAWFCSDCIKMNKEMSNRGRKGVHGRGG